MTAPHRGEHPQRPAKLVPRGRLLQGDFDGLLSPADAPASLALLGDV